jgi:two-component system nitrogen regulation response regulator GlnG
MPSLLVVDDERNVLYSLQQALRSDDLEVRTAQTARQGIASVERRPPDAVILDVRLPDMSGLDAFDRIRAIDARLPVIIVTAFAATETAIEAMKRGAFEYLLKPVDLRQLREVVARAVELSRLRHVPAAAADEEPSEAADRIVGRCPGMQAVYKAVGRVAAQDVTVLITGESGTGKELVARAIYNHSRRVQGPFLAINCAAIPENLLESELFGHERGAFTGADRQRVGKFEQAHGGTLFLDEIGDMTPATQAKVLRVLQDRRFERVGGSETVAADVRVLAATNQSLEQMVEAGRFRQDLLYRLNGFTIRLPPLRDRGDDLRLLVDYFLRLANLRLGKGAASVAPEALRLLQRHDWPGNVRELENAVRYAVVHAVGDVVTPGCLPDYLRGRAAADAAAGRPAARGELDVAALVRELLRAGAADVYRRVWQRVDRAVLEEVLQHVKGNQVQAAELLGISRTTLRLKMRALGMALEKQLQSGPLPPQ